MKLGAKKTGTISFEEAEARAKAEAERIEKIGFEAAEEERLQKLAAEKAKAEAAAYGAQANSGMNSSSAAARTNYYQANTADKTRVSSEDMERLGMGMGRMGFGAAPAPKPAAARSGFGSLGSSYSPQVEGNLWL
jgi:ADP-ribosylation factor GTPase-activating protein 2/3